MQVDNTEILKAARSVPCIEVIDGPAPAQAKKVRRSSFYPDKADDLVEMLRGLRRRERFLVALNESGIVTLYRRVKA